MSDEEFQSQPHGRRNRNKDGLTPREQEVRDLKGQGFSNQEIAEKLGIGIKTVGSHIHTANQASKQRLTPSQEEQLSHSIRQAIPRPGERPDPE